MKPSKDKCTPLPSGSGSSRAEYISELQSTLEESKALECKQKELEEHVEEILYLLDKIDSYESHSWQEELSHVMHGLNVQPSNRAKDYLAKAKYAQSVNDSLKKDWERVGGDMWVSLANMVRKNKEVNVK